MTVKENRKRLCVCIMCAGLICAFLFLYGIPKIWQVGTEQSPTTVVQMYPIRLKVVFIVPKHIKILNKHYPTGDA